MSAMRGVFRQPVCPQSAPLREDAVRRGCASILTIPKRHSTAVTCSPHQNGYKVASDLPRPLQAFPSAMLVIPCTPANSVRVAFLGYDQPTDGYIRPAGGYISQSEAEALVRALAAERLSQKRIRAFPPNTVFFQFSPSRTFVEKLPPIEVGGCHFVSPVTEQTNIVRSRPRIPHLKQGWDWSQERISA
jgi:hypothetical protein